MKFRYDPQPGALYSRLREGQIHETLELAKGTYLDIDIEGRVLGAEFLYLEEFTEFTSHQGKVGVELPDCLAGNLKVQYLPLSVCGGALEAYAR